MVKRTFCDYCKKQIEDYYCSIIKRYIGNLPLTGLPNYSQKDICNICLSKLECISGEEK